MQQLICSQKWVALRYSDTVTNLSKIACSLKGWLHRNFRTRFGVENNGLTGLSQGERVSRRYIKPDCDRQMRRTDNSNSQHNTANTDNRCNSIARWRLPIQHVTKIYPLNCRCQFPLLSYKHTLKRQNGPEQTAPSKTKDRMSSVSSLMGVESNSGTADARAACHMKR